jgi:predicted ArsR family transcriptional regulator
MMKRAPTGRSGAVFRVLQDGPGTVVELAAELEFPQSHVRMAIDSLRRSGCIQAARDPRDDRRPWLIHDGSRGRPLTMYMAVAAD